MTTSALVRCVGSAPAARRPAALQPGDGGALRLACAVDFPVIDGDHLAGSGPASATADVHGPTSTTTVSSR
jgi:hypothetical protein